MTLDLTKLKFHSHLNHNPECDILVYQIDQDTSLTFGTYIAKGGMGNTFCEYYRGENYNVNSKLKSYSRHWNKIEKIPRKYFALWLALKNYYIVHYYMN